MVTSPSTLPDGIIFKIDRPDKLSWYRDPFYTDVGIAPGIYDIEVHALVPGDQIKMESVQILGLTLEIDCCKEPT